MSHESDSPELDEALRELAPRLDAFRAPTPPVDLVETTLARARVELRSAVAARMLPAGYRRELARLVAAAGPVLALAGVGTASLLSQLPDYLAAFLPKPVAWAAALAYVSAAALWLAFCAGSLPFLAHRRSLLRAREAA